MLVLQVGELVNNRYRIINIVRVYNDILVYEVEHISTKQLYIMKLVDLQTSATEIVVMFVNEIRIMSSLDHPAVAAYVESFVDLDKLVVCSVFAHDRGKNLNEVMYSLTTNKERIAAETVLDYLVQFAVIGMLLDKHRIEMMEMDPKNLYVNEAGQVKLGSCLKFFPPNVAVTDMQEVRTENVTAPELILRKTYTKETNVWHFGYLLYLLTSLKFNFQRAKPQDMEKLSPFFYKVLENSKIRTNYPGAVFQSIWIMMQPESDQRASWEEILSAEELQPYISRYKKKFPGAFEEAANPEIRPLKPLIEVTPNRQKLNISIQEVYGSRMHKNSLPNQPSTNQMRSVITGK